MLELSIDATKKIETVCSTIVLLVFASTAYKVYKAQPAHGNSRWRSLVRPVVLILVEGICMYTGPEWANVDICVEIFQQFVSEGAYDYVKKYDTKTRANVVLVLDAALFGIRLLQDNQVKKQAIKDEVGHIKREAEQRAREADKLAQKKREAEIREAEQRVRKEYEDKDFLRQLFGSCEDKHGPTWNTSTPKPVKKSSKVPLPPKDEDATAKTTGPDSTSDENKVQHRQPHNVGIPDNEQGTSTFVFLTGAWAVIQPILKALRKK